MKSTEPRRQPSRKRGVETRNKILAVTADFVRKNSVHKLTTNHIAAEAGIPVASLYRFFPNKESILFAINEEWHRRIEADLAKFFNGDRIGNDFRNNAQNYFQHSLDNHYKNADAHAEIFRASTSVQELRDQNLGHQKRCFDIFRTYFAYHGVNDDEKVSAFLYFLNSSAVNFLYYAANCPQDQRADAVKWAIDAITLWADDIIPQKT